MKRHQLFVTAGLVLALLQPAGAQIAVSGFDGKQPHLGAKPHDVTADGIAVIDLGATPPRVMGKVDVPFSMIGPPTSVAVAHDGSFAIATNSQKLDPKDASRFVPDDTVSLIRLAAPAHPVVLQTVKAGAGATGVAISPDDGMALVANVDAGTVSVFAIDHDRLKLRDTVQLNAKDGPCDVGISPDGKTALVTQRHGTHIWRLAIRDGRVTDTGITYATGINPYGVVFSPDSRFAYNTNLMGRIDAKKPAHGPRIGTITAIDLTKNMVAATMEVGPTPENIALSPDGRYGAVTVVNGSSAWPTDGDYHDFGFLKIYRLDGAAMTEVAQARTGQWGQGAVWRQDGKVIVLQTAIRKMLEVYRFDGHTLTRDPSATLQFHRRPGAIMSAVSR